MPVETTLARVQYGTNGTTGPWSVPFYFISEEDLAVFHTDVDGNETALAYPSDFSVAGAGDPTGGTVTSVAAYDSGGFITITRAVEALQPVEYQDGDSFPAGTTNRALDRLTMLAQRVLETVSRALTFPVSDGTSGQLPSVSSRANRVLAFNASGNPIPIVGVDSASAAALDLDLRDTSSSTRAAGQVGVGGGLNYAVRTLGWFATREIHVDQFEGYDATPGADNTAVLAAAHAAAALIGYCTLVIPRGTLEVTAIPDLVPNVSWRGYGRLASGIEYTGTADGMKFAGPVNDYTALRITLRDFFLHGSNASNVGGGITLESCSYVDVQNVYVLGFKYGHILDQITQFRCSFSEIGLQLRAGVWIVNGATRRVGALKGFTNNIWYGMEVQLIHGTTSGIYSLQDDGGANHEFSGVNFSSGDVAAVFCGVSGLRIKNCAAEDYLQTPFGFGDTDRETGAYVGPCAGVEFSSNSISNPTPFLINLSSIRGGVFVANGFAGFTNAAFTFGGGVRDVRIERNVKSINGSGRNDKSFFSSALTGDILAAVDTAGQAANTYVAASQASGSQTVTPKTMEQIKPGMRLLCQNDDGSNTETVFVASITSTTFTATFASSKAANWTITGQGASATSGTWTPVVVGTSTPGTNTYTTQRGDWTRRPDGSFHIRGALVMSVKDAGMAGSVNIGGLPVGQANVSDANAVVNFGVWSGLTLPANYTALAGVVLPNTSQISLRRMGSGQTATVVAVSEIAAGAVLVFEAIVYPG